MNQETDITTGYLNQPAAFTQPAFFQRMLDQLSEIPELTTRDSDDPTIALLDAWAMVLDVMSFYQQQYNREGYLSTATELYSIRELARMINYELNPGVAASTYLAFQVDPKANNTGIAIIPQNTQVQSLPNQGNMPQAFETSQDFIAYADWNQLQPYQPQITIYQTVTGLDTSLWIAGTSTGLVVGDMLLLSGKTASNQQPIYSLVVQNVVLDAPNNRTQVVWQQDWAKISNQDLSGNNIALTSSSVLSKLQLFRFKSHVAAFGHNAPLVSSLPASSYYMQPGNNDWDGKSQVPAATGSPKNVIPTVWQDSQGLSLSNPENTLHLNQSITGILNSSYILLSIVGTQVLYKVAATAEISLSDFGLSGQVTALTLSNAQGQPITSPNPSFSFRDTAIYAQSEPLSLYTRVVNDESVILKDAKQGIALNTVVNNLSAGQNLIISNLLLELSESVAYDNPPTSVIVSTLPPLTKYTFTLTAPLKFSYQPGTTEVSFNSPSGDAVTVGVSLNVNNPAAPELIIINSTNPIPSTITELTLKGILIQSGEVFTLQNTKEVDGQTILYPEQSLENMYSPSTSIIYGNVVAATHGASVENEVLGSGDGTQTNQEFTLNKYPLTYLSAPTASGIQSTLVIQVNGVKWNEVPGLYGLSANSKSYAINQEEDGRVTIIFGDGVQGARLPTGQENVVASYRQGIGLSGNTTRDSLVLLQTRPQGITGVSNPLPADGAADPQSLTTAFKTAPSTVLTMGRIVSLTDYINFTQAYAGIGKVNAKLLQLGNQPLLCLTVAGENGTAINPNSSLYKNLLLALANNQSSNQNVAVLSYQSILFNVSAKVLVDSAYASTQVQIQINQALLSAYSFDKQDFLQNVTAGQVIDVIRSVEGVVAVDLEYLYFSTEANPMLEVTLAASPASIGTNGPKPAQLLTINPEGITIIPSL